MSNQSTSNKKKITLTDLILFLAAIFIMLRTPWGNMDSFDHLILFLYALCVLLRISNLRKVRMREMEIARKKAEQAQAAAAQDNIPLSENAAVSAPVESAAVAEEESSNSHIEK